jgi:hypothetical protein
MPNAKRAKPGSYKKSHSSFERLQDQMATGYTAPRVAGFSRRGCLTIVGLLLLLCVALAVFPRSPSQTTPTFDQFQSAANEAITETVTPETPLPTASDTEGTTLAATDTDSPTERPTVRPTRRLANTATRRPISTPRPTRTPRPTVNQSTQPQSGLSCPRNCSTAVARGMSAQDAAKCPGLDRDHDGVACYGD